MAMQTHKRTHYLLEARSYRETLDARPSLTPTCSRPALRSAPAFSVSEAQEIADSEVARKALRIAIEGSERIDELSLQGYPTALDPITKDVVEAALFLVARGVLES